MIPVYVINLDQACDRFAAITDGARRYGVTLERIAAIDGKAALDTGDGADRARFTRLHGRHMLPGEFGCYQSHLKAMRRLLADGAEVAVIAEDDIAFDQTFSSRIAALAGARSAPGHPDWDVLKLVNHRTRGFIARGEAGQGDRFGRCLHGPQGSAACYLMTKTGARRALSALATMWLPFDIALERGWDWGASVMTTRVPAVGFSPLRNASHITAPGAGYAATKLPPTHRLPTALFRAQDYARRMAYAIA